MLSYLYEITLKIVLKRSITKELRTLFLKSLFGHIFFPLMNLSILLILDMDSVVCLSDHMSDFICMYACMPIYLCILYQPYVSCIFLCIMYLSMYVVSIYVSCIYLCIMYLSIFYSLYLAHSVLPIHCLLYNKTSSSFFSTGSKNNIKCIIYIKI